MCGITGFLTPRSSNQLNNQAVIKSMTDALVHRGPDDGGTWVDEQARIALGHRRLAVLDLSPAGCQPMTSASGRFVLVFNGEIYNHLDLRQELEKNGLVPETGWRGHSDTETLLEYIEVWGVKKALQSSVGMFAFALWDKKEKSLTLARDRMGEKPLYYGWQKGVFLFSSELKAMKRHPAFSGTISETAVNLYFHLGYVPGPHSIYHGIDKLTPGTFLELRTDDMQVGRLLTDPEPYWSLENTALQGVKDPFPGDFTEAVDELERLMLHSVKMQAVADVPVGAFLSGGIDSSLVVALMQAATTSKVTTFSIGMPEARYNEAHHARKVAEHLGTHHVEHIIQPEEALAIIPKLPQIWDEPFADSSQVPTHLVCRLAREQATVALSGDGGDEFFWGYPQYPLFEKIWKTRALRLFPWKSIIGPFVKLDIASTFVRRASSIAEAWCQPDGQALAIYWMDKFRMVDSPFIDQIKAPSKRDIPQLENVAAAAALWDAAYYLTDDILVKVDRAAMSVSLETRAPFLDHRVAEFALSLPPSFKLKNGKGKRVLREVLYRYVPRELIDRPKMGFSIPLSSWLKNELRPWAEELLNDKASLEDLGLQGAKVNNLWQEHISGTRDHTDRLWCVLSLLLWKRS